MNYSFEGKNILVTGAGRGIGKHVAECLASQGGNVFALSKNADNIKPLVEKYPKNITEVPCDLRDWKGTETVLESLPAMHHLVNNAGVAYREEFFNISPDVFDEIFGVNVKALMNVTKIVSKKMIDAGIKGSIVNVSSVSAVKQCPGIMTYCASKAAVDMITKCSAIELAPYGIRVTSVNPTIVNTDMADILWTGYETQALAKIPLGKYAETSHCTNAILFLLSDLSGMTTGESLLVDGGAAAL